MEGEVNSSEVRLSSVTYFSSCRLGASGNRVTLSRVAIFLSTFNDDHLSCSNTIEGQRCQPRTLAEDLGQTSRATTMATSLDAPNAQPRLNPRNARERTAITAINSPNHPNLKRTV